VLRRYNEANFIALQDQKSSLEESNRVLNGKFNTMSTTFDRLTAEMGPLQEELGVLRTGKETTAEETAVLKAEIKKLKDEMVRKLEAQGSDIVTERQTYEQSRKGMDEMLTITNTQMEREKQLREEVEKELLFMKGAKEQLETEIASEKRENTRKADLMDALREQLKEVKTLNISMLENLQDAQLKVKDTEDALKKSEKFAQSLQGENQVMQDKLRGAAKKRQELEGTLIELSSTLQDVDAKRMGLETNISIEREYRKNVQSDFEAEKIKTAKTEELQAR
jgi:chromosome segregation ATPase